MSEILKEIEAVKKRTPLSTRGIIHGEAVYRCQKCGVVERAQVAKGVGQRSSELPAPLHIGPCVVCSEGQLERGGFTYLPDDWKVEREVKRWLLRLPSRREAQEIASCFRLESAAERPEIGDESQTDPGQIDWSSKIYLNEP